MQPTPTKTDYRPGQVVQIRSDVGEPLKVERATILEKWERGWFLCETDDDEPLVHADLIEAI